VAVEAALATIDLLQNELIANAARSAAIFSIACAIGLSGSGMSATSAAWDS